MCGCGTFQDFIDAALNESNQYDDYGNRTDSLEPAEASSASSGMSASSASSGSSSPEEPSAQPEMPVAAGLAADGTYPDGIMKVHYIDVGQGDATLVTCEGHAMLIDGGTQEAGAAVRSYIDSLGITTLDYVIATHPDSDHIGGLPETLGKYQVGMVMMPDVPSDKYTYKLLYDAVSSKGLVPVRPHVGDNYALGNALVTVTAPADSVYENTNNYSVGLMIQFGDRRFLFIGDAEWPSIQEMMNGTVDLKCDVYKCGHHGSDTSTYDSFLKMLLPEYAVISCGKGNPFGHPHGKVLGYLKSCGVQVFRTDEQGTIVAKTDGTDIIWNVQPSVTWAAGSFENSRE